MYDAYTEDLERQEKLKEKQKRDSKDDKKGQSKSHPPENPLLTATDEIHMIGKPARIIERMVNQNTHDEIAQVSGKYTTFHLRGGVFPILL